MYGSLRIYGDMMKKLMCGDRLIGKYPDDWMPPEGCDLFDGIADGSMVFEHCEEEKSAVFHAPSLADQILANPVELEKLKKALVS
jgi:hypothetical protein